MPRERAKPVQTHEVATFLVARIDKEHELYGAHNGEQYGYCLVQPPAEDPKVAQAAARERFLRLDTPRYPMLDAPPQATSWICEPEIAALFDKGRSTPGVWCAIRRDMSRWGSKSFACWTPTVGARNGYALVRTSIEGSKHEFKLIETNTGCAVLQGIVTLAYATQVLKAFATQFPNALEGAAFGEPSPNHPSFKAMGQLARALKR